MENHDESSIFLEKFKHLNDSIKKEEKLTMRYFVNRTNQEKEDESKKSNLLLLYIIGGIVVLIFVAFYFIKKNYNKKNKLIEEKSIEVNVMEKKMNTSFGEVIELAKANDPFFMIRFKEVYPEFYNALIQSNEKLSPNDIKTAAYIRLNLSNKEVATFENLTIKTIETKRYRLKKKLGLDAETNLMEWINKL